MREHGACAGFRSVRRWALPLVAAVCLVVMGVSVVAWQDAERAAEEAEAAADEASAVEGPAAAARIAILEGLLQPKSLYAFLDVYDAVSSAVCTDQPHSEAMISVFMSGPPKAMLVGATSMSCSQSS